MTMALHGPRPAVKDRTVTAKEAADASSGSQSLRNEAQMTLDEARAFVQRIKDVTGKFPGFYSGSLIKEQLGGKPADPVFSQCFLWIAQYGPAPTHIPATWPTWTMWQYTDGNVGPQPHSVDGIGNCDRDQFNGTVEQLQQLWGVAESVQSAGG